MIRVSCRPVEGLNGWGYHLREEIVMPRRIITTKRHATQPGSGRTVCGMDSRGLATTNLTVAVTCKTCQKIIEGRAKEREKEERHGGR